MHKSIYYLPFFAWTLTIIVSALAIGVWGQSFAWNLSSINSYHFFPILGLLGFSVMWSHYMVGATKRLNHIENNSKQMSQYFAYTGYAVLLAIVLHPGILIYQRFRDGYGFPPHSYESYVAQGKGWLTLLGSVSLLAFLAFELRRFYFKKSWWKYVIAAGDAAIIAIFYHGLRLGHQLQGSWYRSVWLFYGTTLIIAIIYKYVDTFRSPHTHAKLPKLKVNH